MAAAVNIGTVYGVLRLQDSWNPVLRQASMGLSTFAGATDKLSQKAQRAGTALTVGLTTPLLGIGAAALSTFASFEKTTNIIRSVTVDGEKHLDRLKAAAIEWGAKTKFSAQESAQALAELGKAGFTSQQAIEALPGTLELATAANIDLRDAAAITANTLATFGLSTQDLSHANDILTMAVNSSTIEIGDLRESLKYVGAIARPTGTSLATTAAAAALLGQHGIKGSMAGTALRNILTELINPAKGARDVMAELGIKSFESGGKMMALADVIDLLKRKGADTADVMKMFGDRAGPAMAALLEQGGTALRDMTAKLETADGAARRMSENMMRGLAGALERARGSAETAAIALGRVLAPAAERAAEMTAKLADFVTNKLVPAFEGLPAPVQTAVGAVTALALIAGPALFAIGAIGRIGSVAASGLSLLAGGFLAVKTASVIFVDGGLLVALGKTNIIISALAISVAKLVAAFGVGVAAGSFLDWLTGDKLSGAVERLAGWMMGLSKAELEATRAAVEHAKAMRELKEAGLAMGSSGGDMALPGVGAGDPRLGFSGIFTPTLTVIRQQTGETVKLKEAIQKLKDEMLDAKVAALAWLTLLRDQTVAAGLSRTAKLEVAEALGALVDKMNLTTTAGQRMATQLMNAADALRTLHGFARLDFGPLGNIGRFVGMEDIPFGQPGVRFGVPEGPFGPPGRPLPGERIARPSDAILAALGGLGADDDRRRTPFSGVGGLFRGAFGSSREFGQNLAGTAMQALTGGGSVVKSIGSMIGSNLGGALAKTLTSGAGVAIGGLMGGALNAILPGIGALAGPLLQKALGGIGKLFGFGESKDEKATKDLKAMSAEWLKVHGGIDQARIAAGLFGVNLDSALNGKGRSGLENAKTVLGTLETSMAKLKDAGPQISALANEAARFGGLPEKFSPFLDQMRQLGLLTGQVGFDFREMQSIAEKYGIELGALGDKFQGARIHEIAVTILNDLEFMRANGANVTGVLAGMSDEISALVQDSIKFGVAIPENFRPFIEQLIASKSLLDENGHAITDINSIKFGDKIKVGLEAVVERLDALLKGLGIALPGALAGAASAAVDAINRIPRSIDVDVNYRERGTAGPNPGDIADRARGGPIYAARGTDIVPAMLTPGEGIVSPDGMRRIGVRGLESINRGMAADPNGYDPSLGAKVDRMSRSLDTLPSALRRAIIEASGQLAAM